MSINTREEGDVFIITLKGKIMGGPESVDMFEELKNSFTEKRKKVVIDLSAVDWMNSTGVGLLMSAATRLRGHGGEMRLAISNPKVDDLFKLSKLDKVFKMYPTVDDAVGSYQ